MKLLKQGAESKIFLDENFIIKERISKSYRVKSIDDKLRKYRTRSESKILEKCKDLVNVPNVIDVNDRDMIIKMDFIDGKLLRDFINDLKEEELKKIFTQIGKEISLLHENNIIHQDLTTSNLILLNDKVYFIDFGLSFVSDRIEDRAVDLHLLRQALDAKHFEIAEKCFDSVLEGYKENKDFKMIITRLEKVECRGRYK
ncbi:Kae1-associated kinase Bud32 [archaeon]|nr:Kae1-associated kinase Bud32 [archaeon]|tara:strand:- start:9393 stop:9992 length:600 start_codon:yes stop_codon:yes gene_type:complete